VRKSKTRKPETRRERRIKPEETEETKKTAIVIHHSLESSNALCPRDQKPFLISSVPSDFHGGSDEMPLSTQRGFGAPEAWKRRA